MWTGSEAGRGNKTFKTVAKLINEFDSPYFTPWHDASEAPCHPYRRENLHLIDLLSHAIHSVHQQFTNVKLAGAVLKCLYTSSAWAICASFETLSATLRSVAHNHEWRTQRGCPIPRRVLPRFAPIARVAICARTSRTRASRI